MDASWNLQGTFHVRFPFFLFLLRYVCRHNFIFRHFALSLPSFMEVYRRMFLCLIESLVHHLFVKMSLLMIEYSVKTNFWWSRLTDDDLLQFSPKLFLIWGLVLRCLDIHCTEKLRALFWMCFRVMCICISIDRAIEVTRCNFWLQYVILAPGFIYSIYQFMVKDEGERDTTSLVIIPLLLWRMIHNQIWISISRHRTAKGNARIVDKGLEFDQVDRERNWSVFPFPS